MRQAVLRLLNTQPLQLVDEKLLQNDLEAALRKAGIPFARECRMSNNGVIDFLVDGHIGIECKIGGQKRAVWKQCEGYLQDERVSELIVATSKSMQFPESSTGKPIVVVHLARAWL